MVSTYQLYTANVNLVDQSGGPGACVMNKKDTQKGGDATLGNGEGTIGLQGYRMGGILGSFRLERFLGGLRGGLVVVCKIVWSGRKSNCSLVGINGAMPAGRASGSEAKIVLAQEMLRPNNANGNQGTWMLVHSPLFAM